MEDITTASCNIFAIDHLLLRDWAATCHSFNSLAANSNYAKIDATLQLIEINLREFVH